VWRQWLLQAAGRASAARSRSGRLSGHAGLRVPGVQRSGSVGWVLVVEAWWVKS